jgi:hypothetical protein
MQTFIVIANLGRVRAVKYHKAGDDPQQKAHLVEEPGNIAELRPHAIHEVVTDHAGRFTQSGPLDRLGGMSYGEEHHLKDELETQALEAVAAEIDRRVAAEFHPLWRLVAPQPILAVLQKALAPETRATLVHAEPGDLTRLSLEDLEARFIPGR